MGGMRLLKSFIIFGAVIIGLLYCWTTFGGNRKSSSDGHKLYKEWKDCLDKKMEPMRGNPSLLWNRIKPAVLACDRPSVDLLKIRRYDNKDDTKYHIHPLRKSDHPSTIVTLGVGQDILAEKKLINTLGRKNLLFFGADPIAKNNTDLYLKIGQFYPLAIGAKAGYSSATVLEETIYRKKPVTYVDLVYFLTQMLGRRFFDSIWMDAEGGEYEIFPLLKKDDLLDKNGVVICQLNIEIHAPDDDKKRLIHDFLFQTLDDERYAFFFPVQVDHLRLFFVNFLDEKCVERYIPSSRRF